MYGYKTKHAIISACMSLELSNSKNHTKKILEFEALYKVLSKGIGVDTFGKNLIYLELEKYLIINRDSDVGIFIKLTDKGRSAFMNKYFTQKNHEIFNKRIIDYILAFCNLGVLIAAIITISNSNGEKIKNIQDRLLKIDEALSLKHISPPTSLDTQTNKSLPLKKITQPVSKDSTHLTK